MWRQTSECMIRGPRFPDLDTPCYEPLVAKSSGFCDCNGNNKWEPGERGYDCNSRFTPNKCNDVCEAGVNDAALGQDGNAEAEGAAAGQDGNAAAEDAAAGQDGNAEAETGPSGPLVDCLTEKGWRTEEEIKYITEDNVRNTVIVELNKRDGLTIDCLQSKRDEELVAICNDKSLAVA